MEIEEVKKLGILICVNVISVILVFLFYNLLITIAIAIISTFLLYIIQKIFDIPIEISNLKRLFYSNKDFNNLTNVDDIVNYLKKYENKQFFKRLFQTVDCYYIPPNSRLVMDMKEFYFLNIFRNKLTLIRFNDKESLNGKDYEDRRNKTITKKDLKIFFKDLVKKNKYPDYIPEEKNNLYNVNNSIGGISFM